MISNSIFLVLFLFYKFSCGTIRHHAGYQTDEGDFYGGEARISAWSVPDMNPNSGYSVAIVLVNVNGDHTSLIEAGLHVHPSVYQDNQLRIFTSWSDNATRKPACYNMDCGNFVVANKSAIYPGEVVEHLSQYNGEDWFFRLRIQKDPVTEFWTLYQDHLGTIIKIGWWQKGLGELDNKATRVHWSSFVFYTDGDTGPAMGSGHFPNEGKHKAAYMMELKIFDKMGNAYRDSPQIYDLIKEVDKPDCYNVLGAVTFEDETDRSKFYYGGPAGCKN